MTNQPRYKPKVPKFADFAPQLFAYFALGIIALYRAVFSPVISALWGPACRYEPTCSAYAAEAIARYGVIYGGRIALKRLLRCQPFGGWGFDPLPAANCPNNIDRLGHRARSR